MGEGEKGGRRCFTWEGRDAQGALKVECDPAYDPGYKPEECDYTRCRCDSCAEIEEITEEEAALRAGQFCGALIIEAGSDLFLMEKEKKQDAEAAPPEPEPEPEEAPLPSTKTAPEDVIKKALDAARAVLGKLREMPEQKRVDTLASMLDAYEWIFSDDRAVFRAIRDEAERDADGRLFYPAEVCMPFLIACEASRADPDWFRAKVLECMKAGGFTVEMLRSGVLEVVVVETCATCEQVCNNAGDNAEACDDHKVEAPVPVQVPVPAPEAPAPEAPAPEAPRPEPKEDGASKINRWFKSAKKRAGSK